MSDILDEGLLRKQRRKDFLCRRFRNITLVFTAVMITLYFTLIWLGRGAERGLLVAGLLSIVLQSVACYAAKDERRFSDHLRIVIIIVLTFYVIQEFGLRF